MKNIKFSASAPKSLSKHRNISELNHNKILVCHIQQIYPHH